MGFFKLWDIKKTGSGGFDKYEDYNDKETKDLLRELGNSEGSGSIALRSLENNFTGLIFDKVISHYQSLGIDISTTQNGIFPLPGIKHLSSNDSGKVSEYEDGDDQVLWPTIDGVITRPGQDARGFMPRFIEVLRCAHECAYLHTLNKGLGFETKSDLLRGLDFDQYKKMLKEDGPNEAKEIKESFQDYVELIPNFNIETLKNGRNSVSDYNLTIRFPFSFDPSLKLETGDEIDSEMFSFLNRRLAIISKADSTFTVTPPRVYEIKGHGDSVAEISIKCRD